MSIRDSMKPGDVINAYGRAWKIVETPLVDLKHWTSEPPIVFLPLMTKPAREVEKGTKYLPEVWRPNG